MAEGNWQLDLVFNEAGIFYIGCRSVDMSGAEVTARLASYVVVIPATATPTAKPTATSHQHSDLDVYSHRYIDVYSNLNGHCHAYTYRNGYRNSGANPCANSDSDRHGYTYIDRHQYGDEYRDPYSHQHINTRANANGDSHFDSDGYEHPGASRLCCHAQPDRRGRSCDSSWQRIAQQ